MFYVCFYVFIKVKKTCSHVFFANQCFNVFNIYAPFPYSLFSSFPLRSPLIFFPSPFPLPFLPFLSFFSLSSAFSLPSFPFEIGPLLGPARACWECSELPNGDRGKAAVDIELSAL